MLVEESSYFVKEIYNFVKVHAKYETAPITYEDKVEREIMEATDMRFYRTTVRSKSKTLHRTESVREDSHWKINLMIN